MPAAPTPAPTDHRANPSAERTEYYRGVLHELIDKGMDLARKVHEQANAPEPEAMPAADAVVAFDRISRAVRRTIALAQRLDQPARGAASHRASCRKRIIREVEDAIHRGERKHADKDLLNTELRERLDSPDLEDEIDHRPVPEIIADICRDLGIAGPPGPKPWKRRTPADIADLCARARPKQPSAPGDPADEPERLFRLVASPDRD